MKWYSFVYLLTGAMTVSLTASLVGCAGQTMRATVPPQAHLFLGQDESGAAQPGVEVEKIYRTDDPDAVIALTSATRDLWLNPGNYVAIISHCNEQANNKFFTRYGVSLGADRMFHFAVGGRRKYELGCSTSSDGTIYARNDELFIP